ncbi:MAG: DUF4350 domain-containing protein [Pirellulaceae bacterium]
MVNGSLKRVLTPFSLCLALFVLVGSTGCRPVADTELPTRYGSRLQPQPASVNGTRVLSDMFREAGIDVSSHQRITPRTFRSDVLIWFPESFTGPELELRNAITEWLEEDQYRTFIFVGRDFDAELAYWEKVIDRVPLQQRWDARRARAKAVQHSDNQARYGAGTRDFGWFTFNGDVPAREVTMLNGPWADGVDAGATDIRLWSKMETSGTTGRDGVRRDDDGLVIENLLTGDDDEPIVVRLSDEFWNNQIILVNNASFLLNFSLVNPEHRKLAAKLIETCGENGADSIAFVETYNQPEVLQQDPGAAGTSGWEWLSQWPLRMIGLQLAIALIMLCFALFPIFGRAKQLPSEGSSDFKKHIDALGSLLEASGDHAYAQLRIKQYHQLVKGDTVYRRSRGRKG